jgi:hypothetical protein
MAHSVSQPGWAGATIGAAGTVPSSGSSALLAFLFWLATDRTDTAGRAVEPVGDAALKSLRHRHQHVCIRPHIQARAIVASAVRP